jgi:multidrug efflux pump subunit AcrA (membrane-fusion protein)
VEIADRAIKNTALYAPFAGTITQVNGQLNEWTSAFSNVPLVQIVDFSSLYFFAEVSQEDSTLVRVGQGVDIKLDAMKEPVRGEVTEVARNTIRVRTGDVVVPVKIRLNMDPEELTLGWEGNAKVFYQTKEDVVKVPKAAVVRIGNGGSVAVWNGKMWQNKPVELGVFDGQDWEIVGGLQAGEVVGVRK